MAKGEVTSYCKDCRYFRFHYILDKEAKCFTKIDTGHCFKGRIKSRRGYTEGCDYFDRKEALWERTKL